MVAGNGRRNTLKLSAWALVFVSGLAQAGAGVGGGAKWSSAYMESCACDRNLREAIPQVFANRVLKESDFIRVETDLIRNFVKDESIINSRKVIWWSVMELGHFSLRNALLEALDAGVEVHVLTDGKYVATPPQDGSISEDDIRQYTSSGRLSREIYQDLRDGGAKVAYSDPDWAPKQGFPRLMHEKVRLFGTKGAAGYLPLFAYVSTHNDSYSDTQGDVRTETPADRIRAGQLSADDFIEDSLGNVQTSFVLRNHDMLAFLLQNYRDQELVYGEGRGSMDELERRPARRYSLQDGTRVSIGFTYGDKDGPNPNAGMADFLRSFIDTDAREIEDVYFQEFTFVYEDVRHALTELMEFKPFALRAVVEDNFSYQRGSDLRAPAGLYAFERDRMSGDLQLVKPWSRAHRASVSAYAYVNPHDKLHTKNAVIRYRDDSGARRYRLYTGSLNLSDNGASNKEVAFHIDGSATHPLLTAMNDQRVTLESSDEVVEVATEVLMQRMLGMARPLGVKLKSSLLTRQAAARFVRDLRANASNAAWLKALDSFYKEVGVDADVSAKIGDKIKSMLPGLPDFRASEGSLELFFSLLERGDEMNKSERSVIMREFGA